MTAPEKERPAILLGIQSALVGEVFPTLAAVDVSWDEGAVEIRFYVEEELSDADRDSISSIEAEMSAHVTNKSVVSHVVVGERVKPKPTAVCVFARRR